jgi:NADH dehydrogenase
MRCKQRPEVWAAGDCASIPDPNGKPYPELAQHAMREAKVVAENIYATVNGLPVKPFVYKTKGIMASLGYHRGVAAAMGIPLRGFFAWWIRRSYYPSGDPADGPAHSAGCRMDPRAFFQPTPEQVGPQH